GHSFAGFKGSINRYGCSLGDEDLIDVRFIILPRDSTPNSTQSNFSSLTVEFSFLELIICRCFQQKLKKEHKKVSLAATKALRNSLMGTLRKLVASNVTFR
ncbi:hypothetical protein MKW98_001381, partial [Papaver atlanticum]